MSFYVHQFQLADLTTGRNIITSGGAAIVTAAGDPAKLTLYDPDNGYAVMSNPITAVRGKFKFAVPTSVDDVDIYGIAPGGQSFQLTASGAQEKNEYFIDTLRPDHCMVIPFSMDDLVAAAEFDTGFDEPGNAIFKNAGAAIKVVTADATETIDVGTAAGEGGDPNGFLAATSVAALGLASTKGALLFAVEVLDHLSGGRSIVLTASAGSDTAEGFVMLPYQLPVFGA